ncbi:centromere protein S-like [Cloeon dipterum]|uniref:centromere protein S-like n=1 Tax=Cloeon dipterum TaxID=197152 RepID=UPI0032201C4A
MEGKINDLTFEKKVKVALLLEVRKVIEEVGGNIQFAFTKNSTDLIGELVWKKLIVAGSDLEAFAKHAKRTTANPEDVKLLARRNPILKAYISELADEIKSKKEPRKSKNKKEKELPVQQKMETDPGPSSDINEEGANSPVFRADSPIYLSD